MGTFGKHLFHQSGCRSELFAFGPERCQGVYHALGKGEKLPMIRIWSTEGATDSAGSEGYDGLVRAIAEFFHTGQAPVDAAVSAAYSTL